MKARRELNECLYAQKMNGIVRQPYNREHSLYTAIQNGDMETVRQQISDEQTNIFSEVGILSDHPLRNIMYHFVITASFVAGVCTDGGMGHDEAYTLADIYIRKADKCSTSDALLRLMKEMYLDFAERMSEIKKTQVISLHVRKCIYYIYEHLHQDLSVNALAGLTGLNPSYLSRLFAKETGTTIKKFVIAAKIDTAQNLLRYSNLSYLEIALALGFSSHSAFISVFRTSTGMTPKKYREQFYTA